MCIRSYYSKMCYHHKFGHWIGLRAVIVLDHTYIYNLSSKHMVDFEICKRSLFVRYIKNRVRSKVRQDVG